MGRPFTPEDLWRLPRVGAPVASPDGSLLVVPVTTYDLEENRGTGRLWLVPTEDGEPRPLTAQGVDSTDPVLSPNGRRLAFRRKERGETEKAQLYVLPMEGGEPRRVTDLPLGVLGSRWLPDGRLVVLAPVLADAPTPEGTARMLEEREEEPVGAHVTEDRVYRYWDRWLTDGEVPHLFVLDPESGSLRDLIPDSRRWWDWMEPDPHFDVSPDGEEVAFSADLSDPPHHPLRWAVFTVPVDGGETRCLTAGHTGHDLRPRYSPDGRSLVWGMQREWDFYADRVRLVRYDREDHGIEVLTEDWDRSAGAWEFAPDGTLVLTAEDTARSHLFRLDPEGGAPELLAEGGTIRDPAPAGQAVYLRHQSLREPPEVGRWREGRLERITGFTDPVLTGVELGRTEELEVEGSDGRAIQVWLVYPPGFDPGRRWPLVHMIHGGPHGIFGDDFHFRWNAQAFAAPGYVVASVNFHGSSSWGQEFAASIHGAWGDRPARDVLAATDHLVATGFVDPERMAVTGGSYGGFLTTWLATRTDRFAAAICHAGVNDLLAQYASDVTQGRARSLGAEPWEDLEPILAWSPVAHLEGYVTPTLVIHGELDYRVPVTQGLELYNMLKAKGVEARLVHYPDENHWVLKPRNSLHWYGEVLGWLERHLG